MLAEKYRIQAKKGGEWKTQELFSSTDDYSKACAAVDQLTKTGEFDEVRMLEAITDKTTEKLIYKLRYSGDGRIDKPARESDISPPPLSAGKTTVQKRNYRRMDLPS